MRTLSAALLLLFFLQATTGFEPARVGHFNSYDSAVDISGLVYILDRSTVYIKDFTFVPPDAAPGLFLYLKGVRYYHGDNIPISSVGNGVETSLVCQTDLPTCCRGRDDPIGRTGQGEWHAPDDSVILRQSDSRTPFYRARGKGQIRLNRRRDGGALGEYCCQMRNAASVPQSICVNLVSDSDQSKKAGSVPSPYFCAGYSHSPKVQLLKFDGGETEIPTRFSRQHLNLALPRDPDIATLNWLGVCVGDGYILTSLEVHPEFLASLPCRINFLGDFPADKQGEGVSGRLYINGRHEFIVTGFNYADNFENDAVIFTGIGKQLQLGSDFLLGINDNIPTQSIPAIIDQEIIIELPEGAIYSPLSHLTIYSRSRNVVVSSLVFSPSLLPPLPPKLRGVRVGEFFRRFHQLGGTVYALNETSLYIQRFNYDGTGPDVSFRAIQGSSPFSPDKYQDMTDETGSYENLRAYFEEDIIVQLPPGWDVFNTDQLIVWCEVAKTSFGEVRFAADFSLENYEDIQPQIPPLEELCPDLSFNCEQLDSESGLTVSWALNPKANQAIFHLCGCNLAGEYLAFGLSGREDFIQMVNSDSVWTWFDESGAHAQELHVTAYAQCSTSSELASDNNGVCPEPSDDVMDVSGSERNGERCITYTRPINSGDVLDKSLEDRPQRIVWALGPVGRLATSSGAKIPIPFKHYRRADYLDQMTINFWREPVDNCGPARCGGPNPVLSLPIWERPVLPKDTTEISVRIGQAGGRVGYPAFTGNSGWGIAMYLNELLIPKFTAYRGVTYTFTIETGDNPGAPARYHPFYITDSQRGGYLALSPSDQQNERIYAGVDSKGQFLGTGRFCYYGPVGPDQAESAETFSDYFNTLRLECEPGEPGRLSWTPDEKTPSTVYYQCATHQFLGWKINIRDPVNRPPSIEVSAMSPMIIGNKLNFDFSTNLPVDNNLEATLTCKDTPLDIYCFIGSFVKCNTTLRINGSCDLVLSLSINKGATNEVSFTRVVPYHQDLGCGLYARGTYDRPRCYYNTENESVVLEYKFFSVGIFEGFTCKLNNRVTPCVGGMIFVSENDPYPPIRGWNKISIAVDGCDEPVTNEFCYNTETDTLAKPVKGLCPPPK